MMRTVFAFLALISISGSAYADAIVQEGSLSGAAGGGPVTHPIVLDQFDDQGGRRALSFVQLDFFTSTIGGGTGTGSGIPINVSVTLSADYLRGTQMLAETEAVIDYDLPNADSSSFSLFNTDTGHLIIDQPVDMAPWLGPGDITLTGITEFNIVLTPPDEIDFGAGGTVRYTVTYDYEVLPAPVPALMGWGWCALILTMGALGQGVLRSRA